MVSREQHQVVPLTPFHKEWVQARTMHPWVEDTVGLVALRGVQPTGAILFDNINETSAAVHMCMDTPLAIKSGILTAAADVAYNCYGWQVVFAGIPASNLKMLRLALHLGFIPLGELPDALGEGLSRVMMKMHRGDCNFIPVIQEVEHA